MIALVHVRMPRFARIRLAALLVALACLLAVVLPARAAVAAPSFSERLLVVAARYAGVPYVWGGTTPRGFDCSGYSRYVFARLAKKIPRTSQAQYDAARKVGKRVRIGNLVFFHAAGSRRVYHVGIYAGHGRIWHAPRPGRVVSLDRIWTTRWSGGRY
jgi:cell wall-associated NlpC family hydrolase